MLAKKDYSAFSLDISHAYTSHLTVDASSDSMLGAGSFKTAHPGWITLTPPTPPAGQLGSHPRHDVVVKRPYYHVYPPGKSTGQFQIGHFALADELPKLFREANVMYWSKALLCLTYDFIDCFIAASLPETLPFTIPWVRFVEAALALSITGNLL